MAILGGANLKDANLAGADLSEADLSGACLEGADLTNANAFRANFERVNMKEATLCYARFVEANLKGANISGSAVYGISAWGIQLEGAIQTDLIVTPGGQAVITVDNLEVAQFVYLLLSNQKVRGFIDSITAKVVLILGRFTPERKRILDAIRDVLRKRDYLPVLVDFDKPDRRDLTETVSTLAHLARFVVADITDAKSIPKSLVI